MTNIAEELVQKRKDAVLGTGKLEQGKESSRDIGHDLLSALVAANLDAEVPESQRMSHKEIIARKCHSHIIRATDLNVSKQRYLHFSLLVMKPQGEHENRKLVYFANSFPVHR